MTGRGYQDPDVLRRMYWDEGKSLRAIGAEFGVTYSTITKWMDRHGIPRRSRLEAVSTNYAGFDTDTGGYERWKTTVGGKTVVVRHHQLLAIACGYDPHCVFADGMVVHHKNEIPWDNRPDNIELKTHVDHIRGHVQVDPSESDEPWHDADGLRELYHGEGLSSLEIADRMGCHKSTVLDWMDRLGIERRASTHA